MFFRTSGNIDCLEGVKGKKIPTYLNTMKNWFMNERFNLIDIMTWTELAVSGEVIVAHSPLKNSWFQR